MDVFAATQGITLPDYVRNQERAEDLSLIHALGHGIDTTNPGLPRPQVISNSWDKLKEDNSGSQGVNFFLSAYRSKEDAARKSASSLNVDASASTLIGDFKFAYDHSALSQMSTSQEAVVASLHAWSYHGTVKLLAPGEGMSLLSPLAAPKKDDAKAFKEEFGTRYVTIVHYGASVEAALELTSTDQTSLDAVSDRLFASAAGMWGSGKVTATWSKQEVNALSRCKVEIKCKAFWNEVGGGSPSVIVDLSGDARSILDRFGEQAGKLVDYLKQKGVGLPIAYNSEPVTDLNVQASSEVPPWANQRQAKLELLYTAWADVHDSATHFDNLANQVFAPGDQSYKERFLAAARLCNEGTSKIQELGNRVVNGSASPDEVNGITLDSMMYVTPDAATANQLGINEQPFDLRTFAEVSRLNDAKTAYPLRLEIILDRITATTIKNDGYQDQEWTLGFDVFKNLDTKVGSLNAYKAGEGLVAVGRDFPIPIGKSVVIDLDKDWKNIKLAPHCDTTAPLLKNDGVTPQHENTYSERDISREELISLLRAKKGKIERDNNQFYFSPGNILDLTYQWTITSI